MRPAAFVLSAGSQVLRIVRHVARADPSSRVVVAAMVGSRPESIALAAAAGKHDEHPRKKDDYTNWLTPPHHVPAPSAAVGVQGLANPTPPRSLLTVRVHQLLGRIQRALDSTRLRRGRRVRGARQTLPSFGSGTRRHTPEGSSRPPRGPLATGSALCIEAPIRRTRQTAGETDRHLLPRSPAFDRGMH